MRFYFKMSTLSGVQGSNIDMEKTIMFSKSDIENEKKGKPTIKGIDHKIILSTMEMSCSEFYPCVMSHNTLLLSERF